MVRLKNLLTVFVFFFFNDTATTEIYTLSLHDALPISLGGDDGRAVGGEIEVAPSRGRFAEAAGLPVQRDRVEPEARLERKSTPLNSSHDQISYAVFCLQTKTQRKAKTDN